MIRTKGGGNGSGEVRGKGKGGDLSLQNTPETLTSGERGGGGHQDKSQLPWYMRSRYYKNPPKEHRFKPGCPPGPGRPRMSLTNEFIRQLEQIDPDTGEPLFVSFVKEQIKRSMSKNAIGSSAAAQMIVDRIEGLLKQRVEVGGMVIHTTVGELLSLANLTDQELLVAEKLGLRALAVAEAEAREGEAGDGQ